jgi:GT2 family glycosyltransferase
MIVERGISLIIAAYNRGPQIASTLDSVLAQTRPPDEVVVVDDGSTDGTGDWVRDHYPNVRVLSIANRGTSGARNHGASEALGDVLMFLDHDDVLEPRAVEVLLGLLGAFPKARAAFADHAYHDTIRRVFHANHHSEQPAFARLRNVPALERNDRGRLYGRAMHKALLRGNLLQQPWAVDRTAFLALGGFEPSIRYCEDWDLYLRLAATVPLALGDEVISTHLVEGENLHLAPGQAAMHMRVIARQIRANFPGDPRAVALLLRRRAMYHKTAGDQARSLGMPGAWSLYVRSLACWPFDPVVAARIVLWAPSAMARRLGLSRHRPSGRVGDAH